MAQDRHDDRNGKRYMDSRDNREVNRQDLLMDWILVVKDRMVSKRTSRVQGC